VEEALVLVRRYRQRENGWLKSSGRFHEVPRDVGSCGGAGKLSIQCEKVVISRTSRALIQASLGRWIVHEISYRDLVRKVSEIWQRKSRSRETRYSDGCVDIVGNRESEEWKTGGKDREISRTREFAG